uniref:Telomere-associated protein Rif1 N-terminal domain-containing protein n=1 Tax=Oryza punctata TaxID=4537 RepID=A0A0E0L8G5_ORYPU
MAPPLPIRAKTVETLGLRRCTAMPPPPSVERQVAEVAAEPDRTVAYARLLHLQRACADDPSAAADLAAASPSILLPLLLRDAGDRDEAVAASALKCLGFALYHPVLISTVSGQMAQSVLDTLIQLIMTTQMKAICNLGVWCISVQELEAVVVDHTATSLLTAVVHAIDNPFRSLSTTFEAAQAIMKLISQNPEKMRELSSIWVPPIYRRLLSVDKAERDMAERCLIKVSSVVLPPQSLLSKAIASDLEHSLLSCMLNMIHDPEKKVQAVKSWGWYISLLGLHVVDNRPLLNKILKVPEQLFIDSDTQVQIATMVAWRNLVNAFFPQASETLVPKTKISPIESRADTNAQLKKIRLIMLPLGRILSRSRNIALSSSCLSTWHHLLYKLGDLINQLPILEAAFGPVLKIVFSVGPDIQNKPLYSFCVNLFHEYISAKVRDMASLGEYLPIPLNQNLLSQSCIHLKTLMDGQRIRWLPWDVTCFDFHLEILVSIVNPELLRKMTLEIVVTVMDSAMQIFRLLVQGVQVDCKAKCAYGNAQICVAKVCKFVKKVFMDLVGKQNNNNCSVLLQYAFQFVKVILEELDHCLLASGICVIGLDIEHIKEMEYADCSPKLSFPGMKSHSYMEMVSPAVYMIVLSLSVVAEFTGELSHGDAEQLAIIICLSNFQDNFHAAVSFMYKQIILLTDNSLRMRWLMVWNKIAMRLNEQTMPNLKFNCGASVHDVLYQFFCYPFFAFLLPGRKSTLCGAESSSESYLSLTHDVEVEVAIEVYRSICANSNHGPEADHKVFLESFCGFVVSIIDENISLFQANIGYCSEKKFKNCAIFSILGELVSGLLENGHILNYAIKEPTETSEESAGCSQSSILLSCLKLVSRFMGLSTFVFKANPTTQHQIMSRFFSSLSAFAGHLLLKKDVLLFFEIIGEQLTECLSLSGTLYREMQQGETINQIEKVWIKIIMCLNTSKLINDGSFLQKQQVLLQAAVNHPHRPISVATTPAWRASRSDISTLQHSSFSVSKLDELPMERRKDLTDPCAPHNAIVLEEIDILRKFKHPIPEMEKNDESIKISVGLGRKRLKIMKYSMKPREPGKSTVPPGSFSSKKDTDASSSHYMESKACRKPELILEMLKRKK